jgi:protein O-mannosyl-transferase
MSSSSGSETAVPRANRALQNLSINELIRLPWVMELLLAATTFLVFCGTLAFGFVYDDRMQILENVSITKWSYVPQYFTQNVWGLINPNVPANYYRPLFLLWLRVNYAIFGLQPTGWHALSVLLHVVVVVQVYWLGRRLLHSNVAAASAALIFAVHPVHIESVTWISGVTDPILAVFMLASTLAFLRYLGEVRMGDGGKWAHAASLIFFALALLSKEVAVMLPLMLLPMALYTRKQHTSSRDVGMAAVPFFLLILVYLMIRQHALSGFSHPLSHHSTKDMLQTWPMVLAFYARQLITPFWISPYSNVNWVTSFARDFWLPLALCLMIVGVAWVSWKKTEEPRLLSALYCWISLPILPVLYLKTFSRSELTHDRYVYISSIGFSVLIVYFARNLASKFSVPGKVMKFAAIAFITIFTIVTVSGEMYWASDLLLFKRALELAPNNEAAAVNLGIMYAEHGRPDLAEPLLKGVYARDPKGSSTLYNYAVLLVQTHRFSEAEPLLQQALKLDPGNDRVWMELANTELSLGKGTEAQDAARKATQLRPDAIGYHAVLGVIAYKLGNREEAEREFREELRRHPENAVAISGLQQLQNTPR